MMVPNMNVSGYLAALRENRDAAAGTLLEIARAQARRLDRGLRRLAEERIGVAVMALIADDGAALSGLRPEVSLNAVVRTRLRHLALNAMTGERREFARREKAARARPEGAGRARETDAADRADVSRFGGRRRPASVLGSAVFAVEAGGAAAMRALTPRQRQVVELARKGMGRDRIAAALGIDESTVREHARSTYVRLTRLGMAEIAMGG